ncbi:MAG: ABC transporter ATP-binding protein [Oscillospiraceae bacterium]|nr:ABC transporter ATP-binding protein [Oscillospiraceae bacterium]
MENTISVKNLVKVYKIGQEKVVALNGVNFDVAKGEICCILGTSGSGKSTLLNMLAGLEKPTAGEIIIDGIDIGKLNEKKITRWRQKNIGFVFQSYNLIPGLTALENVAMPLTFRGVKKRHRKRLAQIMLIMVGLGRRMRHKASQMSGGQQQRVGIARAFVSAPKIVFADEPTGNLDTRTTKEVMELMVRLSKKHNHSLILVTHDREIATYADRIITLRDGMVVSDEHKNIKITCVEKSKERITK